MRLKIFTFSAFLLFSLSAFSQLNMVYQGAITYDEELSDIWGYVAPDDTEYGLVGLYGGVSIVDLTDPTEPTELFFIEGVNSSWRDIKTWGEFAYVSNENSGGLMVIDLSGLPDAATATNWTPSISGLGTLSSIHNVWIDEFGYAYLVGTNLNSGGVIYVDVNTTPGEPSYVGHGDNVYSHDAFVRNNKMYSSEIYEGQFAIYDVTDKENTEFLGSHTTLFNFTHNSWLSDDGTILYTTDEQANATVGAYDVSDPEDIIDLDQFLPFETIGDGVIPHNVHVWDDWLIISYYTDGCILVDGSNPSNLVEVGNFDTYIPASTGFSGAWGAYPYLPSGLVLISDIGNGMYVLEPNYVNACWLEGNITNAGDGSSLADASIAIVSTNVLDQSDVFGDYATGYAVSGTYDIQVSKPGYLTETVSMVLQNDSTSYLDVALIQLESFSFSGLIIHADGGAPVSNAEIFISDGVFIHELNSVANGTFDISQFYEGTYEVYAGKWGYLTYVGSDVIFDSDNNSITIELEEGYEDIFNLDLGWVETNSGISGDWERGVPIGVSAPDTALYITPPMDVDEDDGNYCYVTGNLSSVNSGVLIGGDAELYSPEFDVSDYETPYLSFYSWWFNLNINTNQPGNSDLNMYIVNGIDEVEIAEYEYTEFGEISWVYFEVDLASQIEITSTMFLKVVANSTSSFNDASEGGLDYFRVWDAGTVGISEETKKLSELKVSPNPSNDLFFLQYDLHSKVQNASARVYNSLGQELNEFSITNSKGQLFFGKNFNSGFYIVQLYNNGVMVNSLKLIKE